MITKEQIENMLQDYFANHEELFLVEVKTTMDNRIKIYLDSKERLSIDDCVEASRWLEAQLDREVEDFELEVSSAGIGQPFKVREQYEKALEKKVDVKFTDGFKMQGILKKLTENSIFVATEKKVVVEGKKKKQVITQEEEILLADIGKINEVITF